MWAVVDLVFAFVVRSFVPEGQPVFIKIDALLISMELVPKTFACLVDLVTCREVEVLAEVLAIEIVKFLNVLCVKMSPDSMLSLNMMFVLLSQCSTFVCCGLGAIFCDCGYNFVCTVLFHASC